MGIMFFVVFGLVISVFIFAFVRSISEWSSNNASPRLTVEARVVTKRTTTSHHHDANGFTSTTTHHYVTFEVESGDRMEFSVRGDEYGVLVEGDYGRLSFQGTRLLGFERVI